MKTIAIDCRMIAASGIGIYLQRLLPSVLDGLADFSLLLLGDRQRLSQFGADRAHVEIVPYGLPMYSMQHHRAAPRLLAGRADLLWTPHFNAPATKSFEQLVTIHDMIHIARPEFFPGGFRRWIARWWYGKTLRNANRIIAISDFTAGEIARFFPSTKAKATVIKNFVEPGYADFDRVPIPYTRPYALTVGNIKPHKNVGVLLKAFKAAGMSLDLDLVVVGQSEGFLTGDQAVKEALQNSGDRVHFPGFVEQKLLKSLYAEAVCAVFPSHYEGFGLGHLEAMTLGCPVVASDIPTTREVCGDAALTFHPKNVNELAEKLHTISTDAALRATLRHQGLERARQFPAEKSVSATVELLRSLVN